MTGPLSEVECIVLSGGGAKVAAYPEALALVARHLAPGRLRHIMGTSGGAIVGLLWAAGLEPSALRQLVRQPEWRAFGLTDGAALARLATKGGLHSMEPIRTWLGKQLRAVGLSPKATIAEISSRTGIDLTISAVRLQTAAGGIRADRIFRYGRLGRDVGAIDAALASAAFPVFFEPQMLDIDGTEWPHVDGGVVDNFPIAAAAAMHGHPERVLGLTVEAPIYITGTMTPSRRSAAVVLSAAVQLMHRDSAGSAPPPGFKERVIKIAAPPGIGPLSFRMKPEQLAALEAAGASAVEAWLQHHTHQEAA